MAKHTDTNTLRVQMLALNQCLHKQAGNYTAHGARAYKIRQEYVPSHGYRAYTD
jgi:hypothetical protein